jgi:predicted transposase YbfD/YdcC
MESGEIRDIPEDVWQSALEKGHGRIENREVRIVTDIDWLENSETLRVSADMWKDLKAIIQYRTYRTKIGGETVQTDQYYISSTALFADEFGMYIRGHWSIENNLHGVKTPGALTCSFERTVVGRGPGMRRSNVNIMRKLALKRLRALTVEKKRYSAKLKMLRAVLDNTFLSKALFGK